MRAAICDTFPEPNSRLLQRILLMMQTIASHKAENRMSSSAVAACMAPLLLRPLLAGDCEIENDFDVGGDGSLQLLQAAAAANHAQAIVITLLEEYNSIFGEGSVSPGPDMYMDSEDDGSESEEATNDDLSYDDYYDDEQDESIEESDEDADDDLVSETNSETGDSIVNDEYDDKDHDLSDSSSKISGVSDDLEVNQMLSTTSPEVSLPQCEDIKTCENFTSQNKTSCADMSNKPADIIEGLSTDQTTMNRSNCPSPSSCMNKSITISNGPTHWRCTVLGRASARKNLSMESIDYLDEYEAEIERLEAVKTELQSQIAEEVKVNAKLQSDMETRKKALQERRLFLEQNVARLQEQLLKEKCSRAALEAGLKFPPGTLSELSGIDERPNLELEELVLIEADLANIEWKVNELGLRLNAQLERDYGSMLNFCNQPQQISNHERNLKNKLDTEVAATSESDRSISKQDSHFVGAENKNERKPGSTHLPNKHPPSSKKSGTGGEQGANSTPSTLTKLTSKLNFLKERRSQVLNELQTMDKGKGSELQLPLPLPNKSRRFEFHLPLLSPNKSRGNELHSPLSSPNKSRGCEFYIPLLSPNKSRGSENHSPPNPADKLRKSESQPHHSDRQNEYSELHLKRGISEGHYQSYNVENGNLF